MAGFEAVSDEKGQGSMGRMGNMGSMGWGCIVERGPARPTNYCAVVWMDTEIQNPWYGCRLPDVGPA